VANHRRRIINTCLLTEYAHIMAPGGWLYTITDVPELGEWMVSERMGGRMGSGGRGNATTGLTAGTCVYGVIAGGLYGVVVWA
jgi:hypothetical protein